MARRPDYRLTVDGVDLSARINPRLVALTLTEKRGDEADQLDLVLSDHDGQLSIPRRGVIIALSLGWAGEDLVAKGRFKVDEAAFDSHPDQITIRARSADFTAELRTRREKSWRGVTLAAILDEIARRHGWSLRVTPTLAARTVDVITQSRQSDADFLKRLGRRYDAVATVKAGSLIFAPVGAGTTPAGKAIPPVSLTRSDGDRVGWRSAERETYTGVAASWWSTSAAERKTVTVGEKKKLKRLRRTFASEADARQAAQAELSRLQRGGGAMDYTLAIGRPDLYPERRVTFSGPGLKPEITEGAWLIEEVVHRLSGEGDALTSALTLQTAPPA